MFKKYILVFDIETIPDHEAAFNLVGNGEIDDFIASYDGDDDSNLEKEVINKQREQLTNYHLDITEGKNAFLRQPFHKTVVISYALIEIERLGGGEEVFYLKQLRSGGNEDSTEEELVKGFFNVIEKYQPRLVSFNGRTFDIPVLKYRAMKYGISSPAFYNSGDKWSNYNQRYAQDWHCDLIDVLSDYGASARIKLNEVCSILGFPGKFGVDGGKVTEMFDNNEIKAVRDYCETDVLNTYLVYLRYCQHTGRISKESYNQAIEDILTFISNNKEKQHLQEFKQAWDESCKGDFKI